MIKDTSTNELIGLLLTSLLFFLGFLVTTYLAIIKGFFSLPYKKYIGGTSSGFDVLINIFFYVTSLIISIFLVTRLAMHSPLSPILLGALIHCLFLLINILIISIYTLFKKNFRPKILIKDTRFPGSGTLSKDIMAGLKALLLSLLPLFGLMCIFEVAIILIDGETPPQQEAVKFLIQAIKDPKAIYPTLFAIIVAAPIIEEFLFRGVIQTYLRKKLGTIKAIIFASLLFSFFHFSMSQGIQNIFILLSLFILSLYLGFIYEKTRSLIASITLHVTFNLINTIIIIIYNI